MRPCGGQDRHRGTRSSRRSRCCSGCARTAPRCRVRSRCGCAARSSRAVRPAPTRHSRWPRADGGASLSLRSTRRENFTASSSATNTVSSLCTPPPHARTRCSRSHAASGKAFPQRPRADRRPAAATSATRPGRSPRRAGRSSPPVSATGSLCHGVRRSSCAFSHHVYALPASETTVPKRGLAITLTHGAGGRCSACDRITYSRPSGEKPPMPLKCVKRLRIGRTVQQPRAEARAPAAAAAAGAPPRA